VGSGSPERWCGGQVCSLSEPMRLRTEPKVNCYHLFGLIPPMLFHCPRVHLDEIRQTIGGIHCLHRTLLLLNNQRRERDTSGNLEQKCKIKEIFDRLYRIRAIHLSRGEGGSERVMGETLEQLTKRSKRSILFIFSADCFLLMESRGMVLAPLPPSRRVWIRLMMRLLVASVSRDFASTSWPGA
jgi:hypothetical protein